MPKFMTPSEAESKRQKAIDFLHRIGDDDLAEAFESMSPEEYAAHKGAELVRNPNRRRRIMARRTKTREELQAELEELRAENAELQSENEELQDQIDAVAEAIGVEEEEEEEEDDEAGIGGD